MMTKAKKTKQQYESFLAEVDKSVRSLAKGAPKALGEKRKQIYNTELIVYGLSVPEQRAMCKRGFSFSEEGDIHKIWDYIWEKSLVFEVKSQALLYYETRHKKLDKSHWQQLKKWSKQIDNWEHADRLSKIYAQLYETNHKVMLPVLERWNKSKDSWLCRLSVVGILCYASVREVIPPFEDVIPLVENLLSNEDYYVQKGVGWTLRELYNAYPQKTFKFLEKHVIKISSTAFTTSVEKVPVGKKERLKQMRKKDRKTKKSSR